MDFKHILKLAEIFEKYANLMPVEQAASLLGVDPKDSMYKILNAYKQIQIKIYMSSGQYDIPPEIQQAFTVLKQFKEKPEIIEPKQEVPKILPPTQQIAITQTDDLKTIKKDLREKVKDAITNLITRIIDLIKNDMPVKAYSYLKNIEGNDIEFFIIYDNTITNTITFSISENDKKFYLETVSGPPDKTPGSKDFWNIINILFSKSKIAYSIFTKTEMYKKYNIVEYNLVHNTVNQIFKEVSKQIDNKIIPLNSIFHSLENSNLSLSFKDRPILVHGKTEGEFVLSLTNDLFAEQKQTWNEKYTKITPLRYLKQVAESLLFKSETLKKIREYKFTEQ